MSIGGLVLLCLAAVCAVMVPVAPAHEKFYFLPLACYFAGMALFTGLSDVSRETKLIVLLAGMYVSLALGYAARRLWQQLRSHQHEKVAPVLRHHHLH